MANASSISPGKEISFELNDQGRVAVGDRLGPELLRIDGRLLSVADSQFELSVAAVRGIGGDVTRWSGETVRIQQAYTKQVFERRLDKRRTTYFVAGVVATVAAFIATRSLVGGGDPRLDTKEPPGNGNQQ
jgi:hypothetical protein